MIPTSFLFDQSTLAKLLDHDPVVLRYRAFFSLFDWSIVERWEAARQHRPGPRPHPISTYIKALLVKLCEHHEYITQLRSFLLEHPLLVIELGFHLVLDPNHPYGFDVNQTVPCDRWLRAKQQTLDHLLLEDLFHASVQALQAEIPALGETIAVDVKHIYAWVQENNFRISCPNRFHKDRQPKGDPDCRLGVKSSTNLDVPEGSKKKEKKEALWGYGSGVVAALTADYGDVVLAEYTQPFNEGDVTYYLPLYRQAVAILGRFPTYVAADAAYDAWYVYQSCVHHGGIAAVPLNQHGHAVYERDTDGVPLCPKGLRMHPTYQFSHTYGYRAQRYRCPLLFSEPTGTSCDHAQFGKGKGCVKDVNAELGGQMRVTLDRDAPLFRAIYRQRTTCERINSQAKALGIERPKVRNGASVKNLNTLTYLVINGNALQRARSINASLFTSMSFRHKGKCSLYR